MILVADSGSSNSDWMLEVPDGHPLAFTTKGLNPFFVNEKGIEKVMQDVPEVIPYIDEITEVYFFGSGCSSPDRREMVSNALSKLFPNAFISIDLDLLGSAYATCGQRKGYVGTLGTSSDLSFFDGIQVMPSRHDIGYVLGDEGSGVWFGKKLITAFLYGSMPSDLQKHFADKYRLNKEIVIKNVYQKSTPNAYLASFAPFMSTHIDHPYINQLVKEGFRAYVNNTVKSFADYRDYVFHFVGSIGFHFETQLREVCAYNGVDVGKVLQRPIEELFKYVVAQEKKYEIQL